MYMIHIIRTSQEYEGVSFHKQSDKAYARQVAITKHMEWLRANLSFFTVCFTLKAKRVIGVSGALMAPQSAHWQRE